jgi:hypothetical protein
MAFMSWIRRSWPLARVGEMEEEVARIRKDPGSKLVDLIIIVLKRRHKLELLLLIVCIFQSKSY